LRVVDNKTVLIAPLNWGLGHATRCIPIIDFFIEKGCRVLIASDGQALALLKKEYPQLTFFSLPSYNAWYPTANVILNTSIQAPSIVYAFYKEKKIVQKIVEEYRVDLLISDNRFGAFSKHCLSIMISHQLHLIAGGRISTQFSNFINHLGMRSFDEIWVPDLAGDTNLSGRLSHPPVQGTVHYIGPLSRLSSRPESTLPGRILVVLSGPEPQRTFFERSIREQLPLEDYYFVLAQGLPNRPYSKTTFAGGEIHSFFTREILQEEIQKAEFIISRSGYTTVMDLYLLGKKAIMVPTPGQTEQEYLALHLQNIPNFTFASQNDFSLSSALKSLAEKSGEISKPSYQLLTNRLQNILLYLHSQA
jgi:UDP-N-acetylglucosamine transferase subunit ALG13